MTSKYVAKIIAKAIKHFGGESQDTDFLLPYDLTMALARRIIREVYDNCAHGGWGITLQITRSGLLYLHPDD